MPRFLYSLLLYIILPFTPIKLVWRSLRQPEYRQHIGERYGIYPAATANNNDRSKKPVIWLHCVSVGETRGAAPLISELQKRYPQHQVLLTHATPTGREAGEQLFGSTVQRVYLPYDVPGAVDRFLTHFQPSIGLLMETELWFNLIYACKVRHIPLLLVNARLSERSAQGYAKTGALVAHGLRELSAIAAQTELDAERLKSLGAMQVEVLGNLKFDVIPPADAAEKGERLRGILGKNRSVFLAASTREGEERLILDAITRAQIPNLLTIIVPRHPQRFDEVAVMLKKGGHHYMRRSRWGAQNDAKGLQEKTKVLLGDSMGEMFTYYAACDVAFIGGSLLPLGGQNLIEATAISKPVLVGPHTFNFEVATELAINAGAAWRVKDSTDLADALNRLFGDPEKRQRMSLAALDFSTSAGGATYRIADLVQAYLPVA